MSSENDRFHSGSIPSFHERQDRATGITYHNPSLISGNASSTAGWVGHNFASGRVREKGAPERTDPIMWHGWDYGFETPSRPERVILSHEDHTPISHVGMFSEYNGTTHPAWYLDQQK